MVVHAVLFLSCYLIESKKSRYCSKIEPATFEIKTPILIGQLQNRLLFQTRRLWLL